MSGDASDRDPFEVVAESFLARYRAGERPGIEELAARHPELAGQIRKLLPAMVRVEQDLTIDPDPVAKAVPLASPRVARQLGDYRIVREIGRGGMGVVYEAEQVSLCRRVALKVLPGYAVGEHKIEERFRREAKAAARLHHTNIVPVFEVGREGDLAFYAMQLILGQGLEQVIDELRRLREPAREADSLGPAGPESPEVPAIAARGRGAAASPPPGREIGPMAGLLLSGRLATEGLGSPGSSSRRAIGLGATERFDPDGPPARVPGRTGADGPPAPESSGTAVLPGGKHVSEVDTSGSRQPFYRSVAQIGRQATQGLAYAHARGIVHRDIKPSNLMLDTDGVVWITDFGLAKAEGDGLTATGDILGTLRYMAPERFRGAGDARVDVYAVGLTLYELLTLRPAYASSDRLKLIEQITNREPARPRAIDGRIPRDLETIVLKAIDKAPERRYASADAMSEDLRRFLADEPIRARQVGPSERYWRWARRNPLIAALGGVLTAVLVLATIGSLLAAGHLAILAERLGHSATAERASRREAYRARDAAETARILAQAESRRALLSEARAVSERRRADTTLADVLTSRGLLSGERDAPAEAALWFAAAAQQSATAEDPRRQEYNGLRARNWLRQATLPVAAMAITSDLDQLDFQPRGDLLLVRAGGKLDLWPWRGGERPPWVDRLGPVASARFSPDGASIALGLRSGGAQIREVASGEILADIRHPGVIGALAFSQDRRSLAMAAGGDARVWDLKGRAFLDRAFAHPQQISALAFNREGDRLITACADKRARVFAVGGRDAAEPLYAPLAHDAASPPALIDDDRILVTVSGPSELTRWDMATGKPESKPIPARPWNLQGVAASPDGHWFAAGGYYGPELHAADASRPPVSLGHTNLVTKCIFSPDSTMLLSTSWDFTARLWSPLRGQPLGPPLKHMSSLTGCAWSDDSEYLATGQYGGLLRVWARPVDELVIARESQWGQRPRLSFDGRLVVPGLWHEAAGDISQVVEALRVLTTADGQPAGPEIRLPGELVDSCVCGDNLAVAAVCSRGGAGQLGVWDVAGARARFEPIPLPGLPTSVAARPGSSQLAVLCTTGDLLVFDDRTGTRVLELRHEAWSTTGNFAQVQYTPDGKTLVSLGGGAPVTVNVRDAGSGRLRFAPFASNVAGSNFHSMALSGDGRLLATIALVRNAVQVWDLATGRALSAPLLHPGDHWGLFSMRFSPDGRHLLTGHKDGLARYWDWQAGRLACPPMPHDFEVHDVGITPDGRFALTVTGGRAELHVWELTTGRRIASPMRLGPKEPDSGLALAITPDARRALVGHSQWGSTRIDLAAVDLEALLSPHGIPPADLALLAELATGQRLELGDLSALTSDQWRGRWDRLRDPALSLRAPRRAEVARARDLVGSGIAAFRQGRLAVAVADLQRASERLQPMRRSRPDDPEVDRLLGMSLGFLAASLRDSKRPSEALARFRESLAVYESMEGPNPGDLYNRARALSMMSALEDRVAPDDRETLRARAVGYLRRAIEGDRDRLLPQVRADRDLDPLRGRADLRDLMADASFPRDPFAPAAADPPP